MKPTCDPTTNSILEEKDKLVVVILCNLNISVTAKVFKIYELLGDLMVNMGHCNTGKAGINPKMPFF